MNLVKKYVVFEIKYVDNDQLREAVPVIRKFFSSKEEAIEEMKRIYECFVYLEPSFIYISEVETFSTLANKSYW